MLLKYASSFKKIAKIGLCHFELNNTSSVRSQRFEKGRINSTCSSFINYIDLLYKHKKNNTEEKQEVFWELKMWILNTICRDNKGTFKQVIDLVKKLYNDAFLSLGYKNYIKNIYKDELK